MIGSAIGHYHIVRLLGKGGMGEVYLADDTKLHRQVALKILSADVAADPDRRERFTREARAAAALNHPNIVTIHSVEEAGGYSFLTLEYVDGRTLSEIFPPTGLPLDRLLSIGIALADAVGAAHQRGITHRDLKPANVMLTSDGRVKVLDFGLAKLREELQPVGEATLPTQALTGEGRIVGTVAYMSPEQAEGRIVDQRSDVFSLGVMLYEMAVGQRPFTGDTQLSILSSILRDNPPFVTDLNRELPRDLGKIIRRCLAKDPEDRYQTAKDLRNDLRGLKDDLSSGDHSAVLASATTAAAPSPISPVVAARPFPWRRVGLVAAGLVLTLAVVVAWRYWFSASSSNSAERGSRPFETIGLNRLTTTGTAGLAALSADGRYVAHVVSDERGQSLWLRQVATSSNVEIVAPAEVRFAGVSFSPDNNYVLYTIYPRGGTFATLQQVPVLGGGSRQLVYDIDSAPTFSPDGLRFAFVRGVTGPDISLLMVADANGRNVRELAKRQAPFAFERQLQSVAWSPDGRTIAAAGGDRSKLVGQIVLVDAESGQERVLSGEWRVVRSLAWLPDGSALLVNAQEAGGESTITQLWSVSYPDGALRRLTTDLSSYAGLSLSRDAKTLVTVRGEQRSTIWVSRDGSAGSLRMITTSAGADDGVQGLAWAADGRLLYTSSVSGNSDIWIMNTDGTNRLQLTTDRADDRIPSATPDGRYVVFMSEREGRAIWRMDPSGNGQQRLGTDRLNGSPWTPFLSPDGRWVTYSNSQLVPKKVEVASGVVSPLFDPMPANLPENYHDPAVSPDGRMVLAHYSDPTARAERIAVLPFAEPAKIQLFPNVFVSTQWSRDGRSMVFIDNRRNMGNLWRQSIAGGMPAQLTYFDSELIFHFAFSADGKQLALSRGATISDVVLMTSRDSVQGR